MQNKGLERPGQKTFSFPLPDQTLLPLSNFPHFFFSFFSFLEKEISKVVKATKASPGII